LQIFNTIPFSHGISCILGKFDLLDSKLHSANFEDISLLYLIVNLLVVVFERTHNEIHVLVNFSAVHSRGVELTETFQVEHITFVYDFEELFGLWSWIFLMNFFISG